MTQPPAFEITAEDEDLLLRGIHALRAVGERAPWHVTFHPTSRPDWVHAEAFVSTVGDIYLHPQWSVDHTRVWIQGHLEYQMAPVGTGAN